MRILIAEDDPISRRLLEVTLKKWGYDPIVCFDGRQALAQLSGDAPPDIAILDWMMPEIDGPELCRRVRQKPAVCPIYIMLLTAKAQREDLVAGLASGADDYVTKPFHQQELFAKLQVGIRIVGLQQKLAARVRDLEVAVMRLGKFQQAQKLEAIGQLASGIAHEINTPIQYVGDNVRFLRDSWQQIAEAIEPARIASDPNLEYLLQEAPIALEQSLEGVQRVSKIVRAIRDFAHPSGESKMAVDINRAIETTITIATNEWRYNAVIETDFDSALPPAVCLPGELHQVILNLIINAAHAIVESTKETGAKGTIRISTSHSGGSIEIRVSDNGSGISEEHRARVFDPFFTTRDVGKGRGQGLAIAHSVVVQQHNGKIWFETEAGKGTTFIIQLPIDGIGATEGADHETNSVR